MCTYTTEHAALSGSAKGQTGWFTATRATVYYDHPFATQLDHTVNIDVMGDGPPGQRVALELTRDSARALVRAIEDVLRQSEGH